jgi:hypothetical protein
VLRVAGCRVLGFIGLLEFIEFIGFIGFVELLEPSGHIVNKLCSNNEVKNLLDILY